ncbi:MAG: hypothetical protein J5379_05390 [Clostridiales bacterium]|nr:hypothetical protein [Clostridiales bacterium]
MSQNSSYDTSVWEAKYKAKRIERIMWILFVVAAIGILVFGAYRTTHQETEFPSLKDARITAVEEAKKQFPGHGTIPLTEEVLKSDYRLFYANRKELADSSIAFRSSLVGVFLLFFVMLLAVSIVKANITGEKLSRGKFGASIGGVAVMLALFLYVIFGINYYVGPNPEKANYSTYSVSYISKDLLTVGNTTNFYIFYEENGLKKSKNVSAGEYNMYPNERGTVYVATASYKGDTIVFKVYSEKEYYPI